MLFNKDRPITKRPSIKVATESIYQLYDHQNYLQQIHLDNQEYVDTDYWNSFETVMRKDLCPKISYFKNFTKTTCDKFISGTLNQVSNV
jgi:hypothetical protein